MPRARAAAGFTALLTSPDHPRRVTSRRRSKLFRLAPATTNNNSRRIVVVSATTTTTRIHRARLNFDRKSSFLRNAISPSAGRALKDGKGRRSESVGVCPPSAVGRWTMLRCRCLHLLQSAVRTPGRIHHRSSIAEETTDSVCVCVWSVLC